MQHTKSKGVAITMPQFAESVVTATIIKWLKQPGDKVEEYEPLCEVVTDKVTAELPSTAEGVITEIIAAEGETVDVGAVICIIDGEAAAAGSAQAAEPAVQSASAAASGQEHIASSGSDEPMRHRYSPAVRGLAEQHRIDLQHVRGTGIGGRITRKDVLAYVQAGASAPSAAPARTAEPAAVAAAAPAPAQSAHSVSRPALPSIEVEPATNGGRGDYFIDVTPIRKTIAVRMRQSVNEIPHAWTTIEVDLTNLVKLRERLKDEFKKNEGVNLSYMAFLIKAVVSALKEYPIMNSVWGPDKIVVKRDINISLAVGTEDSVLTPVIQHADQKNIAGIAREVDELAQRTRSGRLRPADMQGGTFTINNTGTFGSILSYPIINHPQAAILTFESIVRKPVVINDMIAVRSMVNLCLSFDHRILDGVICGRFHQRVKQYLESYGPDTNLY